MALGFRASGFGWITGLVNEIVLLYGQCNAGIFWDTTSEKIGD
jgi:hypothetical protein